MEADRFDVFARLIARTTAHRRVLFGLAMSPFVGTVATRGADDAAARKKHKRSKQPKLKRNEFGCVDAGGACQGNSVNCCSGICQGKKPKKGKKDASTCVEHDAGICTPQSDSCAAGVSVSCHPSNESCYCTMTTGNAPFCGDFTAGGEGPEAVCRVCRTDADCQAEVGPGAACVLLDESCAAICPATGRTACVPACIGSEA